ncbi:hypothetical protein A2380_00020 [candidate division WWE3 bacterium RIFOXYB1_FULL_43_24]|uniref:Uncharacterized protein n=2 Tax=Katanobacteria TaxID=422282 RepID=A0A0G1BHA3_UNCKA|nr:MAG: hypothetical protein UU92_C0015G0013 [candidate division WWE3 bacterium GW2011_GWA1_42_12]KKS33859.1 MAG: hypothetical protein UU97_C0019G0004 [candidate division WWE3 bacterium GW2011_GWD1_42_14]KKS36843.1 MAG: hypothetical protein UV00_C0020G0004 [candidate division WWE3 bacterium GW2011_GWF1_42_14]KKS39936.1 MAG: hypothetical protein UV03_C0016G0004 [candidate division WWE3 bacterium GW2011_GWE1_42_16]KKS66500.1 MAG: hypothetical protein UV35_C0013G0013 [candidate division WWE3 bacte
MNHLTPEIQTLILSSLQTARKASELSFLLEDVAAATYKQDTDLKTAIEKIADYSNELANALRALDSGKAREVALESQNLLRHADRIKVEMSYVPSKDFESGLYEIFKTLGYKDFLLEFTVVSDTETGAHIYHNGNFIDISMFNIIKEKLREVNFNSL